jgi:hypothetical protein
MLVLIAVGCTERPRATAGGGSGASAATDGTPSTAAGAAPTTRAAVASPPFATAAAETTAADREARAALPPLLASALDVDRYLTDRYVSRTPGAECMVQSQSAGTEERRRLHLRLGDGSAFVLFARVDTAARDVRRVEIMRNPVGEEQVAFTLDGDGDVTTVIRWPERGHGKAQPATHPAGGPLPRVLRSFARTLWTLQCPAKGSSRP